MKRKTIKINSILIIGISCLILLLLSIHTVKYCTDPLYAQDTWYELGQVFLVINIIVAYVINIPAILSGIFSLLYIHGIKINILSIISSVIHLIFQLLLVYIMFMDPLKFTGWNSGVHTLATHQISLLIVLVMSGIPSLINIILLCKYKSNY